MGHMNSFHSNFKDRSTRNIQEIFDNCIKDGFYSTGNGIDTCSFMCISLKMAKDNGVISEKECDSALVEIGLYLEEVSNFLNEPFDGYQPTEKSEITTMRSALRLLCCGNSPEDVLEVYKNWANRPQPWIR